MVNKVWVVYKNSYVYGVYSTVERASLVRRYVERSREMYGHVGLEVYVSIAEKELDKD